jgi:DNA primase
VATLGTALTAQHVRTLARFAERVVYLFDGDEAGKRAAARAIEFLEWQATPESRAGRVDLLVAMVPEGGDPADHVAAHGTQGMRSVIEGAQPLIRFVLDLRLAEHDLGTPEGRAAALRSAARVLAGLAGSILAHDYANHVADRLQVDVGTVRGAMAQATPEVSLSGAGAAARGRDAREEQAAASRSGGSVALVEPHRRAEEEIVRLAVIAPETRELARESLELVVTPEYRDILGKVVESGGASGTELWERLAPEPSPLAARLSEWLVDATAPEAVESVFRALTAKLKDFALERQIRQLEARLQELDPVKDRDEYDDVFQRTHELQRELKHAQDRERPSTDAEAR